jgi:hypothetical protein
MTHWHTNLARRHRSQDYWGSDERGLWAASQGAERYVWDEWWWQRTELNDDELDRSLNEKVITSSSEALKVVERLAEFAQFRGLEELSNAIFNVNDILMAIVCVSLKSKLVLIPILYDCERRTHFLMNFYAQRPVLKWTFMLKMLDIFLLFWYSNYTPKFVSCCVFLQTPFCINFSMSVYLINNISSSLTILFNLLSNDRNWTIEIDRLYWTYFVQTSDDQQRFFFV